MFLKNSNISSKIKRSKVTDYAALRREISLIIICEKVKVSNCDFAIIFVTTKVHKSKLFRKIFYNVQTEGKGDINTA